MPPPKLLPVHLIAAPGMENPLSPPSVRPLDGRQIDFRGDESLRASALRAFAGSTPGDDAVDALELPEGPAWLCLGVRALRWYRASPLMPWSHRCVFEPSCSRYAELAWRQHGFFSGSRKTLRRLWRCRPAAGGIDFP